MNVQSKGITLLCSLVPRLSFPLEGRGGGPGDEAKIILVCGHEVTKQIAKMKSTQSMINLMIKCGFLMLSEL